MRSRRLRTIAAVLLVVIIAMAIYGARILVPGINRAAAIANRQVSHSYHSVISGVSAPRLNLSPKQAKVLRLDVIVEAAYWAVWIVLVLALMLVAWMDLREVSRSYLNQRRQLWEVAAKAASEAASLGHSTSEDSPNSAGNLGGRSDPPVST